MRILTGADITALVGVADLIAPLADAMRCVSAGGAQLPLRTSVALGHGNRLGVMPGAISDPAIYGAKLLSLFPDNPRHGRSSHAGLMLVFDPATGLPTGCLDAAMLTALRTAAASAVATRALARADATCLAIIGCGEQAHSHLAAMRAVRPIGRALVWGRDARNAAAFARQHGIEAGGSLAECIAAADIVCTVTDADRPLVTAAMLHPGLHLNAVGASVASRQELDADCVPAVRLFTDFRPSLETQAAEIIEARARGLIQPSQEATEIGDVLAGTQAGRTGDEGITLYRSLGIAAQDLAAAACILARAEAAGRGHVVDMR
jgi:alanine dehydrogenase